MFTGIVEEVGRVKHQEDPDGKIGSIRLAIAAKAVLNGAGLGDSISVNGTCLTLVSLEEDGFGVDLAPETMERTNLGSLKPGCGVNLERPLMLTGRLGGHIVQGHIDDTGKILSSQDEGDCTLITFQAPNKLARYIVEKGFVAVDGISLTVTKIDTSSFTVSVIPYTLANTILKERGVGDDVNLEVDIVAKYVESLLRA